LIALVIGGTSAAFNVPLWVSIFIFSVSGVLLLLGIIFYIYLALKDPNYLRSETFQLHMKSIEYMGDKNNVLSGSSINRLIDITDPSPKERKDENQNTDEG